MGTHYTSKQEQDLIDELTKKIGTCQENYPPDIWKPEEYELHKIKEQEQRKFKDAIMQDWNEIQRKDPNEQFRRQTVKDIAEIKDAIRKIGILLSEDEPSKEMQDKHKMLKDAYKKYKMIEALVLGEKK